MPAVLKRRAIDADLLIALWSGDDLSDGYAHSNIALALAVLLRPDSSGELCKLLAVSSEDSEGEGIVERGYERWTDLGKPDELLDVKPRKKAKA